MPDPRFGAQVSDVRQRVVETYGDGLPVGSTTPSVSDDTIAAWLDEGTGEIIMMIYGVERLPGDMQAHIYNFARGAAVDYAAALLADVEHPERSTDGGRLGDVFRSQYERKLGSLTDRTRAAIADLPDTTPTVDPPVGAVWSGRLPTGWERLGF